VPDRPAPERRRSDAASAWELDDAVAIIPSGLPVPIAGTDQFHEFHAHGEHYYLSGLYEPTGVLTFDPGDGWTLFAYQPGAVEQVWTGPGIDLDQAREGSALDDVRPLTELSGWLESRRGRRVALLGNPDITQTPGRYGLSSWSSLELDVDEQLSRRLSGQLDVIRRSKDAPELLHMRQAAFASHEGHMVGLNVARAGMTEQELQVEIEAEFFRAGAERTAYGSIVGGGPNSATLHFAPTRRAFQDGDLILVDAGAEVAGYASDITRTYPVAAKFTGVQRDLYDLVLDVQTAAIIAAGPGVEYKQLHMEASERMASGLAYLGILRGEGASLVEQDAQALFFPHGLGHMLGLATHDVGGCLAGRVPSDRPTLQYLRADLPLQPGYVVTIEPGVYFIRALLEDPAARAKHRDTVNWERVDQLMDFGGIRIEDDVLITETGSEVLSAATPKFISEIESIRREALSR